MRLNGAKAQALVARANTWRRITHPFGRDPPSEELARLLLKHHRLSFEPSVEIHQLPERGIARGLTAEKRI